MVKDIVNKNDCIDGKTKIGEGTIIYSNVVIEGNSIIGKNCIINMGCYIKDSIIGNNNEIYSSYIINSKIGNKNKIGPYAHIRENNDIKDNIKIGSFVELKGSIINSDTKIPHLSYIGDSIIGKRVNIGCGVITANYDGKEKKKVIIEDDVFVGCNTTLIAPLVLHKNSYIGAGSTINKDVPANNLAISRKKQINRKR